MAKARTIPPDHKAFATLPVQMITVGPASEQVAVHVAGRLLPTRLPLICVPGYQRNMSDYASFLRLVRRGDEDGMPMVLVDLKGRGRSRDRKRPADYTSINDAADLAEVLHALAIPRAVFVGQGYGGQVLMALAARHPSMIAGTVLIDAGPVNDARGVVRLRSMLDDFEGVRSVQGLRAILRRVLAADFPGLSESALDEMAFRTHYIDKRNRAIKLFDAALVRLLDGFDFDDVLMAQWPLFDALASAPLMMMRAQLTQQLRRETFDEMLRRRRDAEGFIIENQGSPALLDTDDDVQPIADFIRRLPVIRTPAAAA
ncbi:MAG: alpha/beta hydrolase [Devosia sp.]